MHPLYPHTILCILGFAESTLEEIRQGLIYQRSYNLFQNITTIAYIYWPYYVFETILSTFPDVLSHLIGSFEKVQVE